MHQNCDRDQNYAYQESEQERQQNEGRPNEYVETLSSMPIAAITALEIVKFAYLYHHKTEDTAIHGINIEKHLDPTNKWYGNDGAQCLQKAHAEVLPVIDFKNLRLQFVKYRRVTSFVQSTIRRQLNDRLLSLLRVIVAFLRHHIIR